MLSNKVHEIMTKNLTAAPVTASVHDVMEQMIAEDVGRIIITDSAVPVGVFTEKDVLKRVVNAAIDARQTLIKHVMTKPIRAVSEETHIVDAFGRMYKGKFRHLLVRGRRGRIVGIVSMRRILKIAVELGQGLSESQTLGSITAAPVLCVAPSASISETIDIMANKGVTSVVVGASDQPLGIFTERDVLKRVATTDLDRKTAQIKEVMTTPVIFLPHTTLVGDALAEMYRRDIRNLPVRGAGGELMGIVSMPDILKYARAFDVDEQVRRTWKEIESYLDDDTQYTPG